MTQTTTGLLGCCHFKNVCTDPIYCHGSFTLCTKWGAFTRNAKLL